jgi:hypothetical protein
LVTDVSRQHGDLILKSPNVHVEWTLEDGTTTLYWNVGDQLPRGMCHIQKKRRPELVHYTTLTMIIMIIVPSNGTANTSGKLRFIFWQVLENCPAILGSRKEMYDKTGNVRITQHWGAFVQPLL